MSMNPNNSSVGSFENAAQSMCNGIRTMASLADSTIATDNFVWSTDHAEVHFGALCPAGVELLLTPTWKTCVSGNVGDAGSGDVSAAQSLGKILAFQCGI